MPECAEATAAALKVSKSYCRPINKTSIRSSYVREKNLRPLFLSDSEAEANEMLSEFAAGVLLLSL